MPAINAPSKTQVSTVPGVPQPDLTGVLGRQVNFNVFSGPTASPYDARKPADPSVTPPVVAVFPPAYVNDPTNYSTGGAVTGIGHSCMLNISPVAGGLPSPADVGIRNSGFSNDATPGATLPNGVALDNYPTAQTPPYLPGKNGVNLGGAILTAIGGGFSKVVEITTGFFEVQTKPYNVQPIANMGNGGSRDAGSTPFKGFPAKMVTAVADIANGVAIESGFINRSGGTILTGYSSEGSSATPTNAPVPQT